jgi:DNA-binding LacI/PurR family transcriptional regulator
LTEYLRSLGHRKIAFVGHHIGPGQLSEREKTFVNVLNSAEVQFTTVADSDGFAGGQRAAQQLFSSGFKPSAILCVNDCMAIGVLRQLRELGLSVPHDVSVAGFDDISLAEVIYPSLTTLHIPRKRIGRWIFESPITPEIKLRRLQGIVLEPVLVVRESTGLAPRY